MVGSRLAVADIVTTIRQNDNSVTEAAEYLEVPVEHVEAALGYYTDYKEEVDGWIERALAAGEDHFGMIFTYDATMPRTRAAVPMWVDTLEDLLRNQPDEHALRNRVHHLP